jgi:UDP-N-acetyl-D-mannosaminuronic acid dehydrogenase
MNDKFRIAIYGAMGRIGLPYTAYLASSVFREDSDVEITAIDLPEREKEIAAMRVGIMPFEEKFLAEMMADAFSRPNFSFSFNGAIEADVHIILVGTPLHEEGYLDPSAINKLIKEIDAVNGLTSIVIRSTVPVGFTDFVAWERPDIDFYFFPERVVEGQAIEEFSKFPSIVGHNNPDCQLLRSKYGKKLFPDLINVSAKEAEFMKIATNTARSMELAITNALFLEALSNGLDYNRLLPLMKMDYPRLDGLYSPGTNVGGPCLSKDVFAFDDPFFHSAVEIHNTMIDAVAMIAADLAPERKNVLLLGAAFKPNSDDERGSQVHVLKEKLLEIGFENVGITDILTRRNQEISIQDIDCFIVVTPHDYFHNYGIYTGIQQFAKKGAVFINPWANYMSNRGQNYFKNATVTIKGDMKRGKNSDNWFVRQPRIQTH